MNLVCTSAAVAAMTSLTFAQDAPQAPPTPPTPPTSETEPIQPAPDPEAVKQAEKVIAEMSKTYKQANAITDTLKLKIESKMGEELQTQTQEMSIAIGKGADSKLEFGGMTLIAVDGKLHFVRNDVPDKYFAAPMEGTLQAALDGVFGGGFPLPPQFVLREDPTADQVLKSVALGMMEDPKLTGYRETTIEDGVKAHEITFASDMGKGAMYVVAETNLLERVTMDLRPEHMPTSMSFTATLEMSPKLHDELPEAIAFNAGDRKAVDELDELAPTPIQVGEEAPDFTLPTLSGEKVTLSELRGTVVVLDFWATWCGPCRRALPLLDEFHAWTQTSGQPVKVYAVNVSERESGDERANKVKEFWTKAEYKMPTLLDEKDDVFPKYGFDGIPATVVVGPDGKVVAIHQGFSPDMVDTLKKDVAEATKTKG